jgi:hypothetical protein
LESAHFPALRDLTVYIDCWDLPNMDDMKETAFLQIIDVIALFISRLNPTLERLDIMAELDLAPSFFDKLGHFPHLIKLELSMLAILSDFSTHCPITHFIAKHAATLEYLYFGNPHDLFRSDEVMKQILQSDEHVFSGLPFNFPRLQKLELDLDHFSSLAISLATCIRPFVDTLTTLLLKEQELSVVGLDVVLRAFSRNPGGLKSAWFDLKCLSPQAVDLLAERLPNLADLTMAVSAIAGLPATSERFSDASLIHP